MSKKSNKLLNQLERELQNLPDELFIDEEGKWKDLKNKDYFKQKNLNLAMMSEDVDADMFDIGMEENDPADEKDDGGDLDESGNKLEARKKKSRRGKSLYVPRGRGGRVIRGSRGSIYRKFISERGGRGGRGRERFEPRSRFEEHRRDSHFKERDEHHFSRRQNYSGSRREEHSSSRRDEKERQILNESIPIDTSHTFGKPSSSQDERPPQETKRYSHEADLMCLFDQLNAQLGIGGNRPSSPEMRRVIIEKTIESDMRAREDSEGVRGRWDMVSGPPTSRISVERRSKSPPRMGSHFDQEILERELSPKMIARLRDLSPDLRERFIQEIRKTTQSQYPHYDQSPQDNSLRLNSPDVRAQYERDVWGRSDSLEPCVRYAQDSRDMVHFSRGDSSQSPSRFDDNPRNRTDSPERSRFNEGLQNRERSPRMDSPRARSYLEQNARSRDKSPRMDYIASRPHFDQVSRNRDSSPRMDSPMRRKMYDQEHNRGHSPNSWSRFDDKSRFRENVQRQLSPDSQTRFVQISRHRDHSPRAGSPGARPHFEHEPRSSDRSPRIDFQGGRSHGDQERKSREISPIFERLIRDSEFPPGVSTPPTHPSIKQQRSVSPTLKAHKDKGDIRNSELRSRHRVQSPPKDMHYSGREYGNRSPTQRGSSLEKRYGDYHSSRKRSNSKDSPISLLSSPENKISKWNTDSNIPLEEFPHHARPGTFPAQPGSLQVPASQPQPSEQPQQQSTLQQSIVNSYPQAGYIPPPGTDIPPYSASSYPPSNYGQYPTSYISNPNNNFINYPPPSFPITQPPLSTVQDYPSSMNWADPNPPSIVTPLPGVPSPQDVPSAKSAEESKKEAIEKEQKQQKQTLLKQREEYVRKSSSLQHELELLRNQKRELLEEKSSDNGHILKENQKLQTEIQNKLKAIANVIDMLTGIIGDKDSDGKKSSSKTNNNKPKTSKDSPKSSTQRKPVARSLDNPPPPGVSIDRIPVVILDKPAEPVPTGHPGELHETLSEQKSSENTAGKAVFNYVHYDPEMHWCRVCNVFPKTAKEYLNHLHSSEHKTQTLEKKLIDMPWHQTQKIDEPAHNKGAPTKRVPIRGLQFFISATAWYCKLCDVWIGDLHCASNHLKSTLHSQKYATFAQKNPHWEVDWLADRSHAYEHAAEETRRLKRNVSVNKQATSSSKESQLLSQKDVKSHSSNSNASKSLSEQLIAALKERNIRSSKEEPKTKKKSSSSSSSSTSSSSSDSDDNKKHSIRVAMRNKDNIPSKVPNKDSKETEVPKVKSKWDSPERDNDKSSTNKDKEKPVASSSDDKMLQEWMEVSAPDKDRDMINNLKDRLKHKQQEIDREIEKRREMEKMKYMKESRDRRRDSRWDGSRNSRRDHYEKDSRSSRRSDRTPEKQRERKTSAGKEHDKSDKQSSKNVKGSEPVTGRSSGKLEKPTGGRQIWVPGSDDSDLEENGQSNFEKQLTESVAKKKDSQSAQKSVPKPRLPFIGRMPFIGKFPTTKRKSEDSIVEDPKKDEKPNEENSSKKISDKTVLIWPDIPKLSDKPQIHTESSKKDTNKTKTTTVDSELPKTTKSTSKVVSISSAPVPVETKTVPIVLKTVPAVMPKSTLLLSKTPLLSGPSLPKKKKKSKRKVIDNAGGVEDMDLDDDDDNDGTDKQNLPKDFQDALDILFPSDNPEGQPAASEILTGETVAAMNPQPVTEIIAAPLINTPNTGSLGNHPLHTENMIHQNPINENIIMPGQINLHVAMDPVNIGPPVVLDMPINPPIPMGTGPMGPPGPIDNRIRPPRPMFRMGPPGPMEGRMGPPGPMHGRMRPPGMMGPPGPMDGRMRPPRPMDGRMGPPEIINEEMGMHGPMGVRMGPPGPMGGRMGPHGPMGSRMRPPGPMVGMMRPPGPRGGIMGPPGPMSGRMGPLGHMDEEMGPPGPMDYDMSYGPEGDFDNMEFGPGGEFMEYGPEEGMGPQRPPGTSDSLFKKKNPPSQKKRNQLKKRRDELTAKEQELKQKIKEQAELIAKKEKDKKKAELDELAMLGIDSEDMAAQSF